MKQASLFTDTPQEKSQRGSVSGTVDYDYPKDPADWTRIALVGEAPGAEEARLGHPFVGRSGQLLDKMLKEAGIDRAESLVANVFRVQPPGNKVDHFFISRRAAKTEGIAIAEEYGQFGSAWVREEFAGDIEHLRKTLIQMRHADESRHPAAHDSAQESLVPRGRAALDSGVRRNDKKMIIVALGRTPLWALTGEGGLLGKAGKPLPCKLAPGIEVIPTYHPSFILRGNWGLQGEWLKHFQTALQYTK